MPGIFKLKQCPWCTSVKTETKQHGTGVKWRCLACESHGVITRKGLNSLQPPSRPRMAAL